MKKLEKKHPLAIRWFHWINFPVLMVMIWSGILIYWANDVYSIGLVHGTPDGGYTAVHAGPIPLGFHFFPTWFYSPGFVANPDSDKPPLHEGLYHLDARLAEGMYWHFLFMWLFAVNGILYVIYTFKSGEWRYLVPNRHSFREAIQVALYDMHLSRVHPPRRKFNGAQQISYTAIILMGGLSLLTGIAIYKPTQFAWLTSLEGGYKMARFIHFWLTMGYCAFFVVHVAQVIKTGWNNFRAMITGYEVVEEETGAHISGARPSPDPLSTEAIAFQPEVSTTQEVAR